MSSSTADEYLIFGTLDDSPAPIAGNSQTGTELSIALVTNKSDLVHGAITTGGDGIRPASSLAGAEFLVSGTLDQTNPGQPGDTHDGELVPTYFTYFYNRIHLVPNGAVNLGVVVGTRITDVTIWNAYVDLAVTVTDLTLAGSPNTSIDGAPGTPFDMGPLTETFFDLVTSAATTDFSFSTTLTVIESTAQGPFLTLTGLASLVLALKPERPQESELTWATNVLTSSNGKEQRQSLRSLPRESHNFRYKPLTTYAKNLMRNQFMSHHNKAYGVPVWLEEKALTADAGAVDTTIFLDTSYARFAVDEPVILWRSETNYAVNQIDTVLPDRLVLVRPVGADFPAAVTGVMPMITGQARNNITARAFSPQFEHPEITLEQTDQLAMPTYTPTYTHNGEPLLLDRPYANKALRVTQRIDQKDNDYGLGAFSRSPQWENPKDVREHTWILRTQQQRWEFRKFLFWAKGRGETFYVPTFMDDLVQNVTSASSDTAIDVENHGYAQLIFQNTTQWRSLAFRKPDGTYYTRNVTGATNEASDRDRIQIDSPLGVGYNPGDLTISFLRHVRLYSDRVEIANDREDRTIVSLLLQTVFE